jgi:hypothetical protein
MNYKIKKIGVVTFSSFTISVAVTIVIMTLSFTFGVTKQAQEIFFGEWSMAVTLTISGIAFPFLWRYMKVER